MFDDLFGDTRKDIDNILNIVDISGSEPTNEDSTWDSGQESSVWFATPDSIWRTN